MKNVKPLIVMYSLLLQNLCQNETSDWWLMSPPPPRTIRSGEPSLIP
jgi:hypothetical protein